SAIFPRIHVKDPYQRLGISKEASEEEIRAARNYLISKYAGHKPSVDAIESAHDRIIMQSFFDRKKPKMDLKKKFRELSQSRAVKAVQGRFQTPRSKVIWQTAITFVLLGALTLAFPTEEGPTLQVWIFLCFLVPWHLLDGICNSTNTARSKKLGSEHSMCYICPPFHIINLPEVRDLHISMLAYSPAAVINNGILLLVLLQPSASLFVSQSCKP
ncbi:hypothetical protein BAE44_0024955, partial [Dichanthelium oligosanthes]